MTTTKKQVSDAVKATRIEARNAKTEEVLLMLAEGVEDLKTGEDWAHMLRFQRRFHQYSFRNLVLIMKQMPSATCIAGFNTWKTQGRTVRKGERGLRILAPLLAKREDENGEESTSIFGFKTVCVFDIAQTEGAAVPTLTKELECSDTERAIAAFECLKDFTEEVLSIPVEVEAMDEGQGGYLSLSERRIAINKTSNCLHRAKTLAHELGHALLHLDSDVEQALNVQEVEAESVAFCIMNAFGFDTSSFSFGYVASWSGGDAQQVLESADRICKAVKRVLACTLDLDEQEPVAA